LVDRLVCAVLIPLISVLTVCSKLDNAVSVLSALVSTAPTLVERLEAVCSRVDVLVISPVVGSLRLPLSSTAADIVLTSTAEAALDGLYTIVTL
jgi:hypothetical protein